MYSVLRQRGTRRSGSRDGTAAANVHFPFMLSIEGVVTIVQEARFQLLDDDGVGHHFLLAHQAPADPEQLTALLQKRTRVRYTDPPGVIAHRALSVVLLDEG